MGTQKISKYYCLILLFLLTTTCGITIREYKLNAINGTKIKVTVTNNTHEPNLTAMFTKTIEESLIKRGAVVVDNDAHYNVIVILNNLKSTAYAYTVEDIAGTYVLQISGSFFIKVKQKDTPVSTGVFNISSNYNIKNIINSELERANALKKTAIEVAENIYGKLAILPQKP
jgi:hypothetical protein